MVSCIANLSGFFFGSVPKLVKMSSRHWWQQNRQNFAFLFPSSGEGGIYGEFMVMLSLRRTLSTEEEASNLGTQDDLVTPQKRRPNASDEQAMGHAHVITIREVNWIT